MFLQKDHRFTDPTIKKYGCYYLALAFLANKYTNCIVDPSYLQKAKKFFVKDGTMLGDCYIQKPDIILEFFGLDNAYLGHKPADHSLEDTEIEILRFERTYEKNGERVTYGHFVAGDRRGHVAYDPMGNSNAVKHGYLESKRVFRLY